MKQNLSSASKVANITCRHARNSFFEYNVTSFLMTAIVYVKWLKKVSINVTDISYLYFIIIALVKAKINKERKPHGEAGWSE